MVYQECKIYFPLERSNSCTMRQCEANLELGGGEFVRRTGCLYRVPSMCHGRMRSSDCHGCGVSCLHSPHRAHARGVLCGKHQCLGSDRELRVRIARIRCSPTSRYSCWRTIVGTACERFVVAALSGKPLLLICLGIRIPSDDASRFGPRARGNHWRASATRSKRLPQFGST